MIALTVLAPFVSQAVLIGHFPSVNEQPGLPAHVLIAGRGGEVGTLFQQAASAMAHKIADQGPHGRIIVLARAHSEGNVARMAQWGFKVQDDGEVFSTKYLIRKLGTLRQGITTLDFFGHNSAGMGFQLDGPGNRLPPTADGFEAIKGLMARGSFVRLHGCNTGFYLAPWMASKLGVPVAGTFAADDFQELYRDNRWYYHDAGRYPGGSFLPVNHLSYSGPKSCAGGGCVRLMPVASAYKGAAGESFTGLNILKFFCPMGEGDVCAAARARALRLSVGIRSLTPASSWSDVVETLAEQFCPASINQAKYADCIAKLREHALGRRALPRNFNLFSARALSCDARTCHFSMKCGLRAGLPPNQCRIDATGPESTTLMDEFDATLRGWRL